VCVAGRGRCSATGALRGSFEEVNTLYSSTDSVEEPKKKRQEQESTPTRALPSPTWLPDLMARIVSRIILHVPTDTNGFRWPSRSANFGRSMNTDISSNKCCAFLRSSGATGREKQCAEGADDTDTRAGASGGRALEERARALVGRLQRRQTRLSRRHPGWRRNITCPPRQIAPSVA
jgi:hypothetical protein